MDSWVQMEDAEAKNGIQRRPEEILFHDINGFVPLSPLLYPLLTTFVL